jgi:hypothetical protein
MQEVVNSHRATVTTECVHIFPESNAMISGVDKDAKVRFVDVSSVASGD